MKGIVLIKFGEFVEQSWGTPFWEELIDEADLPSEGVYTSVATVDDSELLDLIALLVKKKNITPQQAQIEFGKWVFTELLSLAPAETHSFNDVFEFLYGVQNLIHVEVKKLNPDAILPEFDFLEETANRLVFEYRSPRLLCRFCEGLIVGLAEHTQQQVNISHLYCIHEGDERCVLEIIKK